MSEVWLPVLEFEGLYEVSNLGRVRSLDKVVVGVWGRSKKTQSQTRKGKILKLYVNTLRGGYNYVNLKKDGSQKNMRVSGIVAASFIGLRPDGLQVCHNNGVPTDDRFLNLRYDTAKNNSADRKKHGTHDSGEKSVNAKITEKDAIRIKYGKESRLVLSEKFGIHKNHITNIRSGIRWPHI